VALVSEPERYEMVRRAAIEWGNTFSWEATADELLAIAQSVSETLPASSVDALATETPKARVRSRLGHDVARP
jgi:hypothetical protein